MYFVHFSIDLYKGHSEWCEMITHCSFDLHFSNNWWCWALFHVFVGHLHVFFGEMSIWTFSLRFVFLMLNCLSCLYILEINLLSVVLFANIFFHSEDCLFILFVVFLCCAKVLKFNLILFVYSCFYLHYSRMWFRKDLTVISVKECSTYVFLKEFHSVHSYI